MKRAKAFSWGGAALVAAILAVANFLSSFAFLRLDLSSGGVYSVSSGTKSVLKNLQDNLVIKVYFTRRLPPPYGLNEQYLRDLLGEYKSAGRGRVKLEFLNPEGDEKIKQEAIAAGVSPVRLSVMARDKFEIKEAFMGLALLYKGKSDVLPVVQERSQFEYDITRRIKKLTSSGVKTVGLVSGHGEKATSDQSYEPVMEAIREQVNLQPVTLDKRVPAVVDALWIVGPEQPYKPGEIEMLKAWVGSGRSLGILLDHKALDLQSFTTRPIDAGLDGLLSQWGVEPRPGFVADLQAERLQVQQRQGAYTMLNVIEYPLIPIATNMNASHPATRGLDAVVLPFAHPLVVKTEGRPLKYTSLIDSTRASWYETRTALSPFDPIEPQPSAEKGPFSMAGIIEGDFYKITPATFSAVDKAQGLEQAPGRVILVGTSRLIHPSFAAKTANLAAFENLLEWSLQDEALLSIRSKGMSYRPFRPLGDAARAGVKNLLIFLPSALLLIAGALIYRRQRRRRETLRAAYAD